MSSKIHVDSDPKPPILTFQNRDQDSCTSTERESRAVGRQQSTGRLSCGPDPILFKLLYEQQAERDQIETLPYLLQIDAAHVLMLAAAGLLGKRTAAKLLAVNRDLSNHVSDGQPPIPLPKPHRGFYLAYEREYIRRLGKQTGGAAHVARSRNDINATLTRLRLRDQLIGVLSGWCRLSNAIATSGYAHANTYMCGFTHLQAAQPSTLGHYFTGILAELTRSAEALDRAFDLTNQCPMGACAGFGTSFPICRSEVARQLGFYGIVENAADAVASRDYLVHVLSVMAMLGITLSRMATDLQAWSSSAYGLLAWGDNLVSTSSIMPQKRNAFVLENIRGQAIRPVGSLVNTLMGMKNVCFSNSVEISTEAASHVWLAVDSICQSMQLTGILIERLKVDTRRMIEFLSSTQAYMTAVADWLVSQYGLSFRVSHDAVSQLVAQSPKNLSLEQTKMALKGILEHIAAKPVELDETELAAVLDPIQCAKRAVYGGGPAEEAVHGQLRSLATRTAAIENRLKQRRRALRNAREELRAAQDRFINTNMDN